MAYWAKVLNGKVLNTSVGDDVPIDNTIGAWFKYYKPCDGTQTQKYNQAYVGGNYDKGEDAFYDPQPYPSWTLDENFQWQPPVAAPVNGGANWNEKTQSWDATE